ncbi:MAG: ATP-binding protein, partial [archaeon]|nr:ATP-binding protein [archaeon]
LNKGIQQIVLELKILHDSMNNTIKKGLEQTLKYMDTCGTDEGHLIIFNRNDKITWDEKIFQKEQTINGKVIKIWGM